MGAGLGLGLGAAYLVAGMGGHAAEYARAEQFRNAAAYAYAEAQPTPASAPESFGQSVMRLMAPSPAKLVKAERRPRRDLDCLTEAVYYEARGESPQGQFAVAQVVMNRVRHPAFPKSVCDVVFQGANRRTGCQFSFACDGSMRGSREASAWTRARRVAARALSGAAIAEVGSATHFHTTGVSPAWGPQMRRVAQVGVHVFYRFAPRRPSAPAVTPLDALEPLGAAVVLTSGPAPDAEIKLEPVVAAPPADPTPAVTPETTPSAPAAKATAPAPAPAPAEAAALKAPRPAAEAES